MKFTGCVVLHHGGNLRVWWGAFLGGPKFCNPRGLSSSGWPYRLVIFVSINLITFPELFEFAHCIFCLMDNRFDAFLVFQEKVYCAAKLFEGGGEWYMVVVEDNEVLVLFSGGVYLFEDELFFWGIWLWFLGDLSGVVSYEVLVDEGGVLIMNLWGACECKGKKTASVLEVFPVIFLPVCILSPIQHINFF